MTSTTVSLFLLRQSISEMFVTLGDLHDLYGTYYLRTAGTTRTLVSSLHKLISTSVAILTLLSLDPAATTTAKLDHNADNYPLAENRGTSLLHGTAVKRGLVFHGSVPTRNGVDAPPFNHSKAKAITQRAMRFSRDRQWEVYDTEKNLVYALSAEVGELCNAVGWGDGAGGNDIEIGPDKIHSIAGETADVIIYSLKLAHVLGITAKIFAQATRP